MDKFAKIAFICLFVCLLLKSCTSASDSNSSARAYAKSPVDELIKEMSTVSNFSIILYDMEFEENALSKDIYRQKYQIITPKQDGEIDVKETGWKDVSEKFFQANVNNMGMEIASKVDGKLSKTAMPAGYSQYVGNPQYGQWSNNGGSSFWEFYGKYAMMSSLFNMMSPINRGSYDDYSRNYRNTNRPYYGTSGGTTYGTASTMKSRGTTSSWGKSQSAFKSSVQKRVSRSSSSSTRTGSSSARTGRSSSSSYRSRGGGFGK